MRRVVDVKSDRADVTARHVEYVGWFHHQRLHESLGDIPPITLEATATFGARDSPVFG